MVDKSLLRRRDEPDGVPRFWMLETIREYALERLTSLGEVHAAAAQHAGYFLELAEQAERRLHAHGESTWLVRLEAEHDNLRAAFDFYAVYEPSTRPAHGQCARTLLGRPRAPLRGARTPRPRARAGAGNGPVVAKATLWAARIATLQGDVAAAEPLYQAALRLARDAHDAHVEAIALSSLGMLANARGDATRGVELTEQAVSVAREGHDDWILASALSNLGTIKAWSQADGGRALFQEALSCFAASVTQGHRARCGQPPELALARRARDRPVAHRRDAKHARRIDYRMMTGIALCFEALLAIATG